MAALSRSLLRRPSQSLTAVFERSFSSSAGLVKTSASSLAESSLLNRSRPLAAALASVIRGVGSTRGLSTRPTSSSLNDPNPNWSNRPPKETILLDGCDFEHWLVVMEKPEGDPTRDEIIDYYIKTLAQIVGSEEEARMKIYSVSTRCYFAFGALVPEEVSHKIKELPKVRWVLPDSYLDVKNKDYGGEPFIDGKAVPYDPKYHEEWIRNNARANERNRRNDRPRNFDRSRNFEKRRENTLPNQAGPNIGGTHGPPPQNMGGMNGPPPPNMGGMNGPPPPNMGMNGPPPPNMGGMNGPPPPNMVGMNGPPPPNMGGMGGMNGPPPPNMGGMNGPPPANMGRSPYPPPPNMGGPNMAPPNMNQNYAGHGQPNNMGGGPPSWSGDMRGNFQPNNGYQGQGHNGYPPNGRNPYDGPR